MRRLASILVATLVFPAISFAHEIGKTQVDATLQRDRTYVMTVRVDPDTMIERVDETVPRHAGKTLSDAELLARFQRHTSAFLERAQLTFDGQISTPAIELTLTHPPAGREGVVRLSGTIPRGARAMTWSYSMLYSSYALVVHREGEREPQTLWLEGGETSPEVPLRGIADPTRMEVARQYLRLGFTHIVPGGLDHILFVLGIFLLSTRLKPVLSQVTAFTIAHSITLALTMYGVVSLSPRVVEPLIALSIVYVAVENVATQRLHAWRVAIVFAFGLLHGMGFAGVLRELGLPRREFATALVTFNVGVELGQLAVLGTAFAVLASWSRKREWYHARVVVPASLLIACVGAYWTVTRMLS